MSSSVHPDREATIQYTSKYSAMNDCISGTAAINTTTDIDYEVVNQTGESYTYKYLKGGLIFGDNILAGDYIEVEIIDLDGFGVTAGWYSQAEFDAMGNEYVVKHYIAKRYVHPTCSYANSITAETPGKIPVGLYIRFKYTAINSGSTRNIFINLDLQNKDEA